MKLYPRQEKETRTFIITGKKYCGCEMTKTLVATTQYDEEGNVVPYYDGEITRYAVQKYDSVKMPIGMRYFSTEMQARRYFNSNNF